MFGLVYNHDGEVKIFTVYLAPSLHHYDDEIRTLHTFIRTLVSNKPITETKNLHELDKFFASYSPSAHKAFKDQYVAKMSVEGSTQEHAIAVTRFTTDQFYTPKSARPRETRQTALDPFWYLGQPALDTFK